MAAPPKVSDDSLARIRAIAEVDPATLLFIKRLLVETYSEFVSLLYEDLDLLTKRVQERKQLYFDATEDAITMYLVDLLKGLNYIVEHDIKIGGHVDIVVRGRNPLFLWLGEAKRDRGAGWLESGMEQLCTRYSDGTSDRDHGGILVYVQQKRAAQIFQRWREALEKCPQFEDIVIEDCPTNPRAAFISTHIHETSGLPYRVRHMSIALFHDPLK